MAPSTCGLAGLTCLRCTPLARPSLLPPRLRPLRSRCSHSSSARPARTCTVAGASQGSIQPGSEAEANESSVTYYVSLKKPLGIVFREARGGGVEVDEVIKGGHAASATPCIATGDVLLSTTAEALTQGARTESVVVNCQGQRFDAVMAAIRSNTCSNCLITLTLRRATPDQH